AIIEVAQYSPNELAIIGLQVGTTTLTLWFDKSREPLIYLVNTVRDPSVDDRRRTDFSKLERKLALLFPNSKVYLIPFSGKIVVKGQAHDSEEAATILQIIRGEVIGSQGSPSPSQSRTAAGCATCQQTPNRPADSPTDSIVNMLEIPGEFQVMLRVRIAELDRSELRSMGVDLTHLLFDGRHSAPGGRGNSASAGIFENREIRAVMNGLMANGTAKILSEPVLTVVSGHSASFLSGGEFAVPTIVGVEGASAQQTKFHGFGTSLVVTPVVLDRDLIRMNIVPEFSQLNAGNTVNGIPGVDTRRAETTVQLREGQTIVLAGLISSRTTTETSRIRFLSDLPIVGPKYFSGKRSKQDETELLILVTPEIVRPMDADEVPPVPGHEVTAPNDCELYRYGMTEGAADPTVYQVPPFGAGHSAGVPVDYHLFDQRPGSPVPQAPLPQAPVPSYSTGSSGAAIPISGGYVPPPAAPPAASWLTQGLATPSHPAGIQTAQKSGYPSSSFAPIDRGLDVPPPISNAPLNGGKGTIQQTSAWTPAPQGAMSGDNANALPNWSQRPFRSFSNTESTPQRPNDGPTIIPSGSPTAQSTDATAPSESSR
ncbi:MAG TPA: pilus assembly protein N-terminal domain-containing protein, partial [Planctomycetaceae bacterium]|nr:pilus assembly protein N-terminal domain-containing protein [Planctomycetaceae bacterium]